MKNKQIWIVLAIIVIAIATALGYVAQRRSVGGVDTSSDGGPMSTIQQNEIDTSDWVRFQNTYHDISFRYPAEVWDVWLKPDSDSIAISRIDGSWGEIQLHMNDPEFASPQLPVVKRFSIQGADVLYTGIGPYLGGKNIGAWIYRDEDSFYIGYHFADDQIPVQDAEDFFLEFLAGMEF